MSMGHEDARGYGIADCIKVATSPWNLSTHLTLGRWSQDITVCPYLCLSTERTRHSAPMIPYGAGEKS